jgi:hypothetical protein
MLSISLPSQTLVLIAWLSVAFQICSRSADHVCKDCAHHAVSPFISGGIGAERILLRNRTLVPVAGAGMIAPGALIEEEGHLIVQFEAGKIDAGLAALRKRGIEVLQWVPNYAVSVKAPKGASLDGINEIRWAGPLRSSDKVSAYLGTQPGSSSEHVVAELFPGADRKKVSAKLERLGIATISNPHLGDTALLLKATKEKLKVIAGMTDISYLFPASKDVIAGVPVRRCPGPMTEYGPLARFATNGEGWDGQGQNAISLTYHFRNGTPDLANEETLVVNALQTWSNFANITWTRTATNNLNRSMAIQWGPHPSYPFDGPNGTLAYCFYPSPPNSEPVAGDCYFDEGETWTNNGGTSGTDLYSVALHEAGHGLGLNHSDDPNAVMYPYYQFTTELKTDDILGIRALYASVGGGGGGGGGGGDTFEPDDSSGDAKRINNGISQSRSIIPATDQDWAYFDLTATVEVTLETIGSSGDTRMWLYNNAFTEIEFDDDDGTDFFSIIRRTLAPGRYYVKIDEYNNNNEIVSYSLMLSHAGGGGGGDSFEPDNSTSNAKSISSGTVQTRSIVPANDDDYARFTLTSASDVTITTDGPSGDTELWLYGSNLSTIEFDDDSGPNLFSRIDRLAAEGDALPAGTYYILVDDYGDDSEIPSYTLTLTIGATLGDDDAYEQNDTLGAPTNHGFNWERTDLSSISGPGIQADEDWFLIDVDPAGYELVTAEALFSHAQGDIDLAIFDGSGNRLALSNSFDDDESLNVVVPQAGSYFLRVYYGNNSNLYDLWWDDLPPSASRGRAPSVQYRSPRPRAIITPRQLHTGVASDDKAVGRVRYNHAGIPWRAANFSRSAGWWSFRPVGLNQVTSIKRWIRVSVRVNDVEGYADTTRRIFRRETSRSGYRR